MSERQVESEAVDVEGREHSRVNLTDLLGDCSVVLPSEPEVDFVNQVEALSRQYETLRMVPISYSPMFCRLELSGVLKS